MKIFHECDLSDYSFGQDGCGHAIIFCYERKDGTLWVYNEEYESQVNYCPACGYRAVIQVKKI